MIDYLPEIKTDFCAFCGRVVGLNERWIGYTPKTTKYQIIFYCHTNCVESKIGDSGYKK